jgi:4-diphosphocytidyl-2-C-methyl-D-erythritol kinase
LEAPVLEKFPLLALFQEFLLENGASVALMSGSGSTTFALAESRNKAQGLEEMVRQKFGNSLWLSAVEIVQKTGSFGG